MAMKLDGMLANRGLEGQRRGVDGGVAHVCSEEDMVAFEASGRTFGVGVEARGVLESGTTEDEEKRM